MLPHLYYRQAYGKIHRMNELVLVLPLVFLAGFIDSIAGGGGLISLPAYLIAGIPIHQAMGTNKLSSSFGSLSASITFFLHRKLWLKLAFYASFFAFTGAYLGTRLALLVPANTLKTLLILVLPFMALFILRKRPETTFTQEEKTPWIKIAWISFLVGMYDGFIGPGTGTLLIFGFVGVVKMAYTQASANAKVVNLASGLASLVAFSLSGNVNVSLGILAAGASILGNVTGSHLAIKMGKRIIQPMLVLVLGLLLLKLVWDQLGL